MIVVVVVVVVVAAAAAVAVVAEAAAAAEFMRREIAHASIRSVPIIGESPTLPGRLAVMPPVDVAKATWPARSSATAPTVSQPVCRVLHINGWCDVH